MASAAELAAAADWPALARQSRRRRAVGQGVLIGGLALISLPILLPYLWMLVLALTARGGSVETTMLWRALAVLAPAGGAAALAGALAPSPRARRIALVVIGVAALGGVAAVLWPALTAQNFRVLWNRDVNALARGLPGVNPDRLPSVWVAFGNSLAFALAQTALVLAVATPAGYALSRYGFGGRAAFLQSLLVLHAFPAMTLIIPIFLIMHWSGLLDTLAGVALVVCTLELPFAIFIMKGFFDGVPWDIEMSAIADGATRLKAFVSVVLPQVRAGLLAVAVFTFLRGWEEYVFVRTLLYEKQNWTMSLYLFWLADDVMGVDQGLVAGVAVLYVLPALVLYVVSQRYLLQMSVGGIKG